MIVVVVDVNVLYLQLVRTWIPARHHQNFWFQQFNKQKLRSFLDTSNDRYSNFSKAEGKLTVHLHHLKLGVIFSELFPFWESDCFSKPNNWNFQSYVFTLIIFICDCYLLGFFFVYTDHNSLWIEFWVQITCKAYLTNYILWIRGTVPTKRNWSFRFNHKVFQLILSLFNGTLLDYPQSWKLELIIYCN